MREAVAALLIVALLLHSVNAVMTLQQTGISFGAGEPVTVDVDFLDASNKPIYTLKGDVKVPNAPSVSNSVFLPERLVDKSVLIRKIKIRAGEGGMTIKLFEDANKSMPNAVITMTTGFLNAEQPIEFDLTAADGSTVHPAELKWYDHNPAALASAGGMALGKIELSVVRAVQEPLRPVPQYIPLGHVENPYPSPYLNPFIYPEWSLNAGRPAVLPVGAVVAA